MNPKHTNSSQQEIDLYFIWKNFIGFIDKIILLFVRAIRFLIRNIFVILAILIIGAGIGYFIDSKKGTIYKHEVMLAPNFGSSTFLYEKVKNMSFEEDSNIINIHIEPIIDIYDFLSSTPSTLKIAEFMSENNVNILTHKHGNQTEKIYRYHLLTFFTDQKDIDGKIIDGFLSELNKEEYFLERQKIEQENTTREIQESLTSIQNINAIFNRLSNPSQTAEKRDLNIEMYFEINGLLYSKQTTIEKLNKLKVFQLEQTKIFYDVSKTSNIKTSSISTMVTLPLLFIFLYVLVISIIKIYRRYDPKSQAM